MRLRWRDFVGRVNIGDDDDDGDDDDGGGDDDGGNCWRTGRL